MCETITAYNGTMLWHWAVRLKSYTFIHTILSTRRRTSMCIPGWDIKFILSPLSLLPLFSPRIWTRVVRLAKRWPTPQTKVILGENMRYSSSPLFKDFPVLIFGNLFQNPYKLCSLNINGDKVFSNILQQFHTR